MEDPDRERYDALIEMPTTLEEAHLALKEIEGILKNLQITSSDGTMSGNHREGFAYNP